jgi:hypothetical protein
LQEYLPNCQASFAGWTDFVGIGRMVLSYPELPPTRSPAALGESALPNV